MIFCCDNTFELCKNKSDFSWEAYKNNYGTDKICVQSQKYCLKLKHLVKIEKVRVLLTKYTQNNAKINKKLWSSLALYVC